MPFNIATFRQHLNHANNHYARFVRSSMSTLEELLAGLGPAVGPANLNQIQALWAAVPHAKQQKYAAAAAYLKQFVAALVDAIPVSPTMRYVEFRVLLGNFGGRANFPARYYHVHRLTWQSSNGSLASLANVLTREQVVHRTPPAAPPFNPVVNAGIPLAFTSGGGPATAGMNEDDHSVGNPCWTIAIPVLVGRVIADQTYQYSTDNGATWQVIPGAVYELEKGVRPGPGGNVFYFIKRSAPNAANRFRFEVEYPIVAAPAPMAGAIPVVPAGFLPIADIGQYARVLRRG